MAKLRQSRPHLLRDLWQHNPQIGGLSLIGRTVEQLTVQALAQCAQFISRHA